MKMRKWIAALLAMLLLFGCAGAETTGVHGSTINAGMEIAMVNGEVYCMFVRSGLRDRTTLCRWTETGFEEVWSAYVNGSYLYAMDDALVLVHYKQTFWEEFSGAGAYVALRIDPVTWETETLLTTRNAGRPLCHDGELLRFNCSGFDGDTPWCTLETWRDGQWVKDFSWRSDFTDEKRRGSYLYPGFVILEQSEVARDVSDVRLRVLDSGEEYLLRDVNMSWAGIPLAVLEDGRLYRLEDKVLYVHDLQSGTTETLLTLTGYSYYDFIMDETRLIFMGSEGLLEVYDRATLSCQLTVQLPDSSFDWLISGDTLYAFDPTSMTYRVNGEESVTPASMSEVNLVTGESRILELN